jgi:hypothetical protein
MFGNMTISISIGKREMIPEIVEFTRTQYGDDFFTCNEYFTWRYFNPLMPDSFIVCAHDRSRLVGTTGISMNSFIYKGHLIKVALVQSALVSPSYRHILLRNNNGLNTIFGSLLLKVEEESIGKGCYYICAFPNGNSFPHFIELGYVRIGFLDFIFCPINFSGIFQQFGIPGFVAHAAGAAIDICYAHLMSNTSSDHKISVRGDLQEHLVEGLWQKNIPHSAFTQVRDGKNFNWRILKTPEFNYESRGAFINEELRAYIVWKTGLTKDRIKGVEYYCTKIVDLWVSPGKDENVIAQALVSEVVAMARAQKSLFILSTLKVPSLLDRSFKSNGFVIFKNHLFKKRIPIVLKKINGSLEIPDIKQIYFTMADNDIV